jgi:hypothetical protein
MAAAADEGREGGAGEEQGSSEVGVEGEEDVFCVRGFEGVWQGVVSGEDDACEEGFVGEDFGGGGEDGGGVGEVEGDGDEIFVLETLIEEV